MTVMRRRGCCFAITLSSLGLTAMTISLVTTFVSAASFVRPLSSQQQQRSCCGRTTRLHLAKVANAKRIKQAGGGLPVITSGDFELFDPAKEGKLAGTTNLKDRLRLGAHYPSSSSSTSSSSIGTSGIGTSSSSTTTTSTLTDSSVSIQHDDAQHWLEDIGVPQNLVKPTRPVAATVLSRRKLIADTAPGDIQHIVLRVPDNFHYVEGQSVSVIPPGFDLSGKPHKPRLYSIASTRYGDLKDGNTVSLCVRRADYYDPVTNLLDDTKRGVCSHFLCQTKPGDSVQIAGPSGKTMLLPSAEQLSNADLIMVATGTGIAPFRAFLHRLYLENTVARHLFAGQAWLILGVPVAGGLLYHDELQSMMDLNQQSGRSSKLEVTYAISREMTNRSGGKYYVQDVLAERADELFQRLDRGAVIYFCGLRGMMPGILQALSQVATERGIDWTTKLTQLKNNQQWHVEVY